METKRIKTAVRTVCTIMGLMLPLTGCSRGPAMDTDGRYIPGDMSVQINGIIVNMADYDSCAAVFSHIDGSSASLTLSNLILGMDTAVFTCGISEERKGKYLFSGEAAMDCPERELAVEGSINEGEIRLSVTDLVTSKIANTWTATGSGNAPDIDINFYNPDITTVDVGGLPVPVSIITAMLGPMLGGIAGEMLPFDRVRLDRIHYVEISPEPEDLPVNGVLQYYTGANDGKLHFYLRKSVCQAAGLGDKPLDKGLGYVLNSSGDSLRICVDLTEYPAIVPVLSDAISGTDYQDYLDSGAPLGDIDEALFETYKKIVATLVEAIALPDTVFDICIGLTPDTMGNRQQEARENDKG